MEGTSYNLKKSMGSAFQTYLPGRERKRNGLGISKDNKLYVCNGRKHQIEVFSSELTLLKHFGEKGSGPSQFNVPHDIAFDNQGNIYVTESGNITEFKSCPRRGNLSMHLVGREMNPVNFNVLTGFI